MNPQDDDYNGIHIGLLFICSLGGFTGWGYIIKWVFQ